MVQKITGEAPFQVLATNFSIGPSNEGYTLQISADGVNYSDLFSVGANVTRMVTGVASGSFYKLSGNASEVSINWRTQCNDGGSGGSGSQGPQGPAGGGSGSGSQGPQGLEGPQGPQGYQGESGATGADGAQGPIGADGAQGPQGVNGIDQAPTILKSVSGTPEGIVDGDVYAFKGEVEVDVPSTEVLSSVTITTGSQITFKVYYQNSYSENSVTINASGTFDFTPWGYDSEADVILGPWSDTGIHVTDNGDGTWTLTSLHASTYQYFVGMYDFNPALKRMETQRNTYQYGYAGEKLIASGAARENKSSLNIYVNALPAEKTFVQTFTSSTGTVYLLYLTNDEKVQLWVSGGTTYLAEVSAATTTVNTQIDYDGAGYEYNIAFRKYEGKTYAYQILISKISGGNAAFSCGRCMVTEPVYGNNKLAKISDLPAEDRLVPTDGTNGDVVMHNYTGIQWTSKSSVVVDGTIAAWPYSAGVSDRQVLVRTGKYDFGWDAFEVDNIASDIELPSLSNDGNVYAYASGSDYTIAQAQGTTSGTGWIRYAVHTAPTGFTQFRVPYNYGEECSVLFIAWANYGLSLYWHPETSTKHWDGLPDGTTQTDGEFSFTVTGGGETEITVTGVRVGDWIVVTFSQAESAGNCQVGAGYVEFYVPGTISIYRHAVMADTPMKLWKGTSAEYGQLPAVDPNTLYIII